MTTATALHVGGRARGHEVTASRRHIETVDRAPVAIRLPVVSGPRGIACPKIVSEVRDDVGELEGPSVARPPSSLRWPPEGVLRPVVQLAKPALLTPRPYTL